MSTESKKPGAIMLWAFAAVAAACVAAAPTASAEPSLPVPGAGSANQAIEQLQSLGYTVSVNWLEGHPNVPLSECRVTGISGLRTPTTSTDIMMMLMEPAEFDTAYVDVACPNAK